MHPGICYIAGAGVVGRPLPPIGPADLVIAADGGYDLLAAQGITPHLFIGDLDSLAVPPAHVPRITLPAEKDDTDMLAAIREGWQRGWRQFFLYGGTGGRLDHTLANIQCLTYLARQGGAGTLVGEDVCLTVLCRGALVFPPQARGTISVFSLSETTRGVWEVGLKYPLSDVVLTHDYPLGVSNEFTGRESRISLAEGALLILYPADLTPQRVDAADAAGRCEP